MPRGILKSKVWKYENDGLGNQPIESRWKKYWLEIDDYHGNLTWYEKFRPCTFRSIEISKIVKYFTNGEDCESIPSCPAVPESKTYRNMFAFPEDIDNDPNKIVFFVVSRPQHYRKQTDRNRTSQATNEDLYDGDVENVGADNTNPTLKVGSADVWHLVGKQNYGVTSLIPKHSLDFLCIQNTKFDKGHFNTRAHGCKMLSLGGKSNSPCVGVIISERWVKQVSEFKYIGKEIVVVKIKGDAICVLSVQCPKVLEEIERFKFFENLRDCLKSLIEFELIIICGGFEGQSYMEKDDRTPILREGINSRDAGMLLKLINEMNLTLENTHLLNRNSFSNGDLYNFILTRNNGANKLAEVRTCSELLLLGHTLSLATFAGDFTVSGHYFRNEDSD
ncbi:hypothetical protein HELRODRAFT_180846 [Helobdella robusta]|uniref:Endonuclease/exonuclease/phosphatase domain-containing protein n=1 Tax=Helobdella robusta TaxID=6412 RepID=T1FGC0_HELRO|nr:hypothetical protein HELRODRAFT_180846 [Helobdella robusta]ESN93532.1 hypothetical protein HELRODRAFT_180846 [Helobdella robusta]